MSLTVPLSTLPQPSPKGWIIEPNAPRPVVGTMTADEYFVWEQTQTDKHEFMDGKVITMPGTSPDHNSIAISLIRVFADALEKANLPNNFYMSDVRVHYSATKYTYPDAAIAEHPAQFDGRYGLQNPLVVIEVLSPSTANYDLDEKFERYRAIESLRHYIVIAQNRVSVTHYEKLDNSLWAIVGTHTTLDDALSVSIGDAVIAVPLQKIYARVTLPDADPATSQPKEAA